MHEHQMNRAADARVLLRRMFVPIYLPAILFATGEGALIPVLPLTATRLGANLAVAGIISGLLLIGIVLGDVPSAAAVSRWGEQTAMRAAGILGMCAAFACWLAPNLWVLSGGALLVGIASATFNLARHSFLTTWTPAPFRARAMSLLGGASRVGAFVGPFLASPIIALWGSRSVYWVHVIACAAVLLTLQLTPDPAAVLQRRQEEEHRSGATSLTVPSTSAGVSVPGALPRKGLRAFFPVLFRLGVAAGLLQLLRASRQVILPLWGVHLGISESQIALVVAVAGAVDLSLFYTSGQVMDRFGRKWAAVPVLLGLGLGHILLIWASTEWMYVAVAIFLSLANGLGSGIVMTLGSDLAMRYGEGRTAEFLGGWRMFSDTGQAAAPLIISGMTALVGLPLAAVVVGCLGFVGGYMMNRFIPRLVGR